MATTRAEVNPTTGGARRYCAQQRFQTRIRHACKVDLPGNVLRALILPPQPALCASHEC